MNRVGTGVRRPLSVPTVTPGPGTYYIPSRGVEGPKVIYLVF